MNEVSQAISTVKRQLRAQGLTYRDVASRLGLSEASVKRVFARETFTVERLAQIARLLGFTLAELLAESASEVPRLRVLTSDQEAKLVGDEKLLLGGRLRAESLDGGGNRQRNTGSDGPRS